MPKSKFSGETKNCRTLIHLIRKKKEKKKNLKNRLEILSDSIELCKELITFRNIIWLYLIVERTSERATTLKKTLLNGQSASSEKLYVKYKKMYKFYSFDF